MSLFNPSESVRTAVKFYADVLQALAIIAAGLWAAFTYHVQAAEQAARAKEQAAAVLRELRRPYDEKQLNLYLEAARVVASLATNPKGPDRPKVEARFWELYYGDMQIVQTLANQQKEGEPDASMEHLMLKFCEQFFGATFDEGYKCRTKCYPDVDTATLLARQAGRELKGRWEQIDIPLKEQERMEIRQERKKGSYKPCEPIGPEFPAIVSSSSPTVTPPHR
jgi:hypothetical protein